MKLGYTILYVENVKKSLDFYVQAFSLEIKFFHESGQFGELKTGETTLAFSSRELIEQLGKNPSAPIKGSPCFEIAFVTEDIPKALEKAISAGAILVQDPEEMPWGQTTAYVRDLDGFLVELCTPVS